MKNSRKFEHKLLQLPELKSETTASGRKYVTPEGNVYPSITTVLSILSEDSIAEWKARVGEEEAAKISKRASDRGTAVHEMIEDYLNNVSDLTEKYMPNIVNDVKRVKDVLDERIGIVWAQEVPLYSDKLQIAGRVDCIAEFDGELSIIDFKTSKKAKKKSWIENYFIQETFYAAAFFEMTGTPIRQLVTIISCDTGEAQVFIEQPFSWMKQLIAVRKEYENRQTSVC